MIPEPKQTPPKMNWLMMRGLAREKRHWGDFPSVFEELLPESKVHPIDLPGTGTEHRRRSPSNIAGITGDVRARWKMLREEHEGPWSILGVSLGGMVALQWCHENPRDFERLVVVNSSARRFGHPLERMSLHVATQISRSFLEKDLVARERRVLGFTTRLAGDAELDRFAAASAGWMKERPITPRTLMNQLFAAARFDAPETLSVPILILAGGQDPLADPFCAWRMARHFRAALHVHPTAGHDLSTDDPRWFALQVRGWLEAMPPVGRRAG